MAWRGIELHIAKRGEPHGTGRGKVRWVVERTINWLKGLRHMRVRYDQLGAVQDVWTALAARVIRSRIRSDECQLAAFCQSLSGQ